MKSRPTRRDFIFDTPIATSQLDGKTGAKTRLKSANSADNESQQKFETASPVWLGLCCALMACILLVILVEYSDYSSAKITILTCVAYAFPGIAYEYRRLHGWRLPAYRQQTELKNALVTSVLKTLGLAQILVVAYFFLTILPEYSKELYLLWKEVYLTGAAVLICVAPFYFFLCETTLGPKHDIYGYLGRYSLIRYLLRVWTRPVLRQAGLMWMVKLFFLPIMLGSLLSSVVYFNNNMPLVAAHGYYRFFNLAWEMILAMDVTLAVVGYLCSLRILNTTVVSTDPTWRGWVATIICYSPFSTVLYGSYLSYEDGLKWGDFFSGYDTAYYIYGSILITMHLMYLTASLNFGIRYSNLSHRGILTDGLFRLTKHPAYLFKNIVWWMIGLPFITNMGIKTAIANCLLLFGVNAVYWWRARTEEMHLSRDPAYVKYALAMNDRSILAFLGRLHPALSYKQPVPRVMAEYNL